MALSPVLPIIRDIGLQRLGYIQGGQGLSVTTPRTASEAGLRTHRRSGGEKRANRARMIEIQNRSLYSFLTTSSLLGMPRDQVENFLRAGYIPLPKQMLFHAHCRQADQPGQPDWIGFGGARGPGKSTATFAQVALDDCQRIGGLKVLFLRRVKKAAKESLEDLRAKLLRNVTHHYQRQESIISFPNDSRILVGHFTDERDIDNYLGIEYDLIVLEEGTSLPLAHVTKLLGSLRTSRQSWRPRWLTTTNPGNIGHQWFKRLFVSRQDNNSYRTSFIPATIDDNPLVDQGYRDYLDNLSGWLYEAWRKGSWDIQAGQFYTNFTPSTHVISVTPAYDWTYWLSLDYGTVHPQAVLLFCQDGDGNIHVLDEHVQSGWLVYQHVEAMDAMLSRHGIDRSYLSSTVAGTDLFARRGYSKTLAEEYSDHGYVLTPAKTDRINGAARIKRLLGDSRMPPRLTFSPTCSRVIETLPSLQHDPDRPEDVLKVDADESGWGGDDTYDALRYGVMESPERSSPHDHLLSGYRG